jgi:hypothetical protein
MNKLLDNDEKLVRTAYEMMGKNKKVYNILAVDSASPHIVRPCEKK